ncbi:MarR family winged helix-turn-helix transcriptional regulator [Qipengyuania flava]|uniref:MarR family winged helix-turn-helix transcriptional regulator n=1 Tax=Qipengyuania flava TaxID=192812 RepID=UPI001C634803|nr:MarR family winged helix-turn-helix transcriptional regulator [Qipengyuania flava]QYJ07469.1 MarR family winged helix-turn-helix transcriptional regulator [Qipengyuania flava]
MSAPRILHLLQMAHSALFRASDLALREHYAIGTAQQAVLFMLRGEDGAPISRLAKQLGMGKSGLTGMIDRMESAGLVRREPNPDDARSFLVFLEPRGCQLSEATLPTTRRVNAALLEPFDAAERATIERFLRRVAHESPALVAEAAASDAPSQDPKRSLPQS